MFVNVTTHSRPDLGDVFLVRPSKGLVIPVLLLGGWEGGGGKKGHLGTKLYLNGRMGEGLGMQVKFYPRKSFSHEGGAHNVLRFSHKPGPHAAMLHTCDGGLETICDA